MDQRLHRRVQLVAWWQDDLAIIGNDRATWHAVEHLLDQVDRGAHLLDTNAEARVDVAALLDDRRVVELAIGAIATVCST